MKNKKIIKATTLICAVAGALLIIAAPLNNVYAQTSTTDTYAEELSTSRSAVIGWRYKTVDGVLYKRLYNYSNGTWIGDWIVV